MAGPNVLFTGPLEHRHLVHLVPLADVTVVPSIFPEAFGMVAAEAAAGGSIPLVARHSGLAEIAEALGPELTSFESGNVADLRAKLERLLALSPPERDELAQHARQVAEERWSWAHVADRLLEPFA
jgi:glycosyltransferase involved in cell wall biosynthesis